MQTPHEPRGDAARLSEQRLRAIVEQAAIGLAVADESGRFVQVNARFCALTGYGEDELRERTFADITHPDDLATTRERLLALAAGEVDEYSLEKRYVRKDGATIWVRTTIAALRGAPGEEARFVGVIEDVTGVRAERELERQTALRLSLAMSAGRLGEWTWHAERDEFVFGGLAATALGLAADVAVPWAELRERIHPEDRDAFRRATAAARAGDGDLATEFRVVDDPARPTWILATGRALPDDPARCGLVGVLQDVTERRRLELARTRLAEVVEGSDDAILSKDLDGTVLTWNAGAQRIFGWSADEMVGRSIRRLIPPERQDEEDRILAALRAGQRIDHYETVRVTKDGRTIDVSLSVSPLHDAAGRIVGASKIARDITARKRVEAELRRREEELRALHETGRAIAADLDLQTLMQTVTDVATRLTGARFGAFFHNVERPTGADDGDGYLLFTLAGAEREAFERFGQPRATPLFGPTFRGEGPIRCDDVTEDPRYGQWGGMPDGHLPVRSYLAVPVVSRHGDVLGGLFFGHERVGVFTERAERFATAIAAQAGIAMDNARLYESVRRSAEERRLLLDAERSARSELERSSMLKDEFLATLGHELRTPLNAIVGWSHVLRLRHRDATELVEGLDVIERNARVQTRLIEDLLEMSRIISGKLRLDVQRVDLQEVVRAAVAAVRPTATARQIRLQVVLDPRAGPVWGDPSRLQQCFWNLLTNAIKFTPKGGRVQVKLGLVNSHVEFAVTDDGEGIDAEFLPHLFERFRQADASTTRRHGGLGIGLSIVKSLVEMHGGAVRATSPGPGQGATFTIDLPIMALDPPDRTAGREHPRQRDPGTPHSIEHPSLAGITVLALDDEPDARILVRRVLEDCGARVVVAGSAAEGLELLRSERPDVVISDIGMPDADGYEFIRSVRRLPPENGGRVPAAALSAFARPEDRTRALRAGYQMHLAKPVEPTELTAVVASLAARS